MDVVAHVSVKPSLFSFSPLIGAFGGVSCPCIGTCCLQSPLSNVGIDEPWETFNDGQSVSFWSFPIAFLSPKQKSAQTH